MAAIITDAELLWAGGAATIKTLLLEIVLAEGRRKVRAQPARSETLRAESSERVVIACTLDVIACVIACASVIACA